VSAAPEAEVVREQLSRILASTDFDASGRNRQFLAFVVEQAIAGRADRIKAYTIATDVFHRGNDFDPQLDSIVRIEAGRLRRSLEHYYLTAGARDPVRIVIPKGSYAPVFTVNESATAPTALAPSPRLAHRGRVIIVRAFEEEGDQNAYPYFTRGFARQLIVGLTRFTDLFVYGSDTSSRLEDAQHLISGIGADFILGGSTTFDGDRLRVEALLVDAATGRYLWAEQYDRPLNPSEVMRIRDEIANKVIRSIAQPHGAIFRSRARDVEGKLPQELSSQDSVVRYYQYTQTYDRKLFGPAFTALAATVARESDYAEAHACLARLHVDAHRFRFATPQPVDDLLGEAFRLALRAMELAPDSSRSHHALANVYWFRGDVESSLSSYQAGLELNPNDAEIMVDFGFRHAMLAQWDKAMPLLEAAFERNPFQPSTYRVALSLYHLAHGRFAESLVEARRVIAPDVLYGHLLRAIGAANLGYGEEARNALAEIARMHPDYGAVLVSDLRSRNIHPSLIRLVISGLSKAGMAIDLAGLPPAEPLVQLVNGKLTPPIRGIPR
jgi:TolB-like protein/Flp pilus assembly protein TadD